MGEMLIQRRKPICYHCKTFIVAVIYYPTYEKQLYVLIQCEEVEQLFDGKRDNHSYKLSTFIVFPITSQATIVTSFLVDGSLAIIPFDHQI